MHKWIAMLTVHKIAMLGTDWPFLYDESAQFPWKG
jgi:hypothetical protein